MEIFIEKENKTIQKEINKSVQVKEILKELNINNETVILVKNGTVALEDAQINDKDQLKILSVVSGG